jgi:hypothetical protein
MLGLERREREQPQSKRSALSFRISEKLSEEA